MATIGTLTVISSLTILLFGFPAQVISNFKRKSGDDLSPPLIYSCCLAYTLWSIYAFIKPDYFLVVLRVPGAILSFVLLLQIFHYK